MERVGQEAEGSIPACSLSMKPTRGKEEVMADTKRRGRQGGSWGRGGEEGGIRPGEEDLSAWRCALSKGSYVGKLHSSNVTVGCGNNQE